MVKRIRHNISDNEGSEDEALFPLPPPHSPGQTGQDEGDLMLNDDEGGDVSKLADVPVAKRKVVRRPQPKLDSHRLISDRGLPSLRTMFDNVHFKGKGHEAADLRLLMQKMENWAHRLYPKLQFEDFIDKVEKLGAKKEVQTCLKRIRLDMPLTHEDFIGKDGEDTDQPEPRVFEDADPFGEVSFVNEAPRPIYSTPVAAAPPTPSPVVPSLTEEQRRRMELNRQRALEKRMSRCQQPLTDSQNSSFPSTAEEPTSSSENVLTDLNNQMELEEELESVPKPTGLSSHKDSDPLDKSELHQEEEEEKQESEEPESVTQSPSECKLEKTLADFTQLKEVEEPGEQETSIHTPQQDAIVSSESTQNGEEQDEEMTAS